MLDRFTDRAKKFLQLARLGALCAQHDCIDDLHLLLGLLAAENDVASVLRGAEWNVDMLDLAGRSPNWPLSTREAPASSSCGSSAACRWTTCPGRWTFRCRPPSANGGPRAPGSRRNCRRGTDLTPEDRGERRTPRAAEAEFLAALDRPENERDAFLRAVCSDDAARLREVRELLDAGRDGAGFPATGLLPDALLAAAAAPGRIGPFRVLRVLGEGGMGLVYEAEQERPRRHVALQVLHPWLLTPRSLRRFELEGEVLGRLERPGIARIYEASGSDAVRGSQPWLAMELVTGEALHDHCARLRPPLEQRLLSAFTVHRPPIVRLQQPCSVTMDHRRSLWSGCVCCRRLHDAERPEQIGDRHARAGTRGSAPFDWQDLPDAVTATDSPRPALDEAGIEESLQSPIDTVDVDAESVGHSRPAVVRSTSAIGGERKQQQHCSGVGLEPAEPSLMQQMRLEPAERCLRPSHEIGPRRDRCRLHGSTSSQASVTTSASTSVRLLRNAISRRRSSSTCVGSRLASSTTRTGWTF